LWQELFTWSSPALLNDNVEDEIEDGTGMDANEAKETIRG